MKQSSWAEAVGIVSIVVSLLFVGYELRQNTKALSSQAILDVAAINSEQFNLVSENAELAALILKAEANQPLTEVERFQYTYYLYNTWNTFEAAYIYYKNDLLDYSDFESWHAAMCGEYSKTYTRKLLDTKEIIILTSMLDYLKETC